MWRINFYFRIVSILLNCWQKQKNDFWFSLVEFEKKKENQKKSDYNNKILNT